MNKMLKRKKVGQVKEQKLYEQDDPRRREDDK